MFRTNSAPGNIVPNVPSPTHGILQHSWRLPALSYSDVVKEKRNQLSSGGESAESEAIVPSYSRCEVQVEHVR